MIKLFIDTCANSLGLAIVKDEKIYKREVAGGKKTAEEMFPLLKELLAESETELTEVKEVYVTKGPGSYTGERLGLTLAKVLATLNPKLSLYTTTTLKALSYGKGNAIALIDARNDAYFAGFYNDNLETKPQYRAMVSEIDEYKTLTDATIYIGTHDKNAVASLGDREYQKASILDGMLSIPKSEYEYVSEPLNINPVYMHGQER